MKKARKEWHPPKKVLCPANVESWDRRGFIQLPNSVCLHGARGLKEKILKGAEENQVDNNVFRITAVRTFGCIDGTQSTLKEELRTHNPHAVWVGNGRCNVIIITTIANVVWIRGNSCNTVQAFGGKSIGYAFHIFVIYLSYYINIFGYSTHNFWIIHL
jgi:hypothetical protein